MAEATRDTVWSPTGPPEGEAPIPSVCAVIVTYNRRELLKESVAAVLGQTRSPDHVVVVDNASDDGTGEMLAEDFPQVEVIGLAQNEGATGGFHEGIKLARERGFDQIWVLDDDTVPEAGALGALLDARRNGEKNTSFIGSKVLWTDGRIHPMNRPWLHWSDTDALINNVDAGTGLLPVRASTWVSLLLDGEAVDRLGLPEKRYFMWSDDFEYTARLARRHPAFMATRSVAIHKTPEPHTALTSSGDRYYFHVRNTLYMLRADSWTPRERVSLFQGYLRSIGRFLRRNRFRARALGVVARGVRDGLLGTHDPAGPYLNRG